MREVSNASFHWFRLICAECFEPHCYNFSNIETMVSLIRVICISDQMKRKEKKNLQKFLKK